MAEYNINPTGMADMLTTGNGVTSQDAISEFVDNSLDANATEIDISLTPKYIHVHDNGEGLGEKEIPLINSLGYSNKKEDKSKIGQWGCGYTAATNHFAVKHHFISNGNWTMTKRSALKPFDSDRVHTPDPGALGIMGNTYSKDKYTHVVLEDLRVEINDQFIKDMKEHLSHAYCKSIQNGIVIKVNGERIEHIDFKYDSSEEDECIIFKLRPVPERDDKIPRFDIETDNEIIKNERVGIKGTLTEEIVNTQAFVKKVFIPEQYDNANYNNVIAKIQISVPKKKHQGRGTGGTCVVMNDRRLNKMTNAHPRSASRMYGHAYDSMKIEIESPSDNFNNRANKGSTSQTLDKFIKVPGLYGAIQRCINKVYTLEKKKMEKEKKKMEKEKKVDTTDDGEVPATDDGEVPADDNEEVPVTDNEEVPVTDNEEVPAIDDENDDIEVEPETSTEPTPVDVRSYRRGPASKDEMLYQLTRVMNIINESDENHYPAALYNQLTKII